MHLDREPDRSRSPSPPPFNDENDNNDIYDEAELAESIAQKEAEMRQTEEIINQRLRQVQLTLAHLREVNQLLERFESLAHGIVQKKN